MDQFLCSIKIEDRAEGKPRLIGTLMEYGTEARDRRESFRTRIALVGRWRNHSQSTA